MFGSGIKIRAPATTPPGKKHGEKVLLSDVTAPIGECAASFSFKVIMILFFLNF